MVWDVIVVGAGPAGLMAAIGAAQEGAHTLLLERHAEPGGKLPWAGAGRCNLSHAGEIRELLPHYHGGERPGEAARFLRPALRFFSNRALASFFAQRGLPLRRDASGRLFPKTQRGVDVVAVLLSELHQLGVAVRVETWVRAIRPQKDRFAVRDRGGRSWWGRTVVLAPGGRARNTLADGYELAAALGHPIAPLRPALAPVHVIPDAFAPFVACAGISLGETRVWLVRQGRRRAEKRGAVLFTHRGLSGPAILDLSREVAPGDVVRVALAPGLERAEAEGRLIRAAASRGSSGLVTILHELGLPRRLGRALLGALNISCGLRVGELRREARNALVESLVEGHPFPVAAVGGWEEAMVTRGGVRLEDVDPHTLESRIVPGLFFAGEILDYDGESGGYNLQAAFSTGFLAGTCAARARRP